MKIPMPPKIMLIEEKAEGGDMLARLAREKPSFLAGYERVCEGAGMALYRSVRSNRAEGESAEGNRGERKGQEGKGQRAGGQRAERNRAQGR